MSDPSPEVVAAALALAEAVDAAAVACDAPEGTPPELFQRTWLARCEALHRYRAALAPKLRTRAEVERELASALLAAPSAVYGNGEVKFLGVKAGAIANLVQELERIRSAEQTAPEPVAPELADPDPCSCDEALALRGQLDRIRALAEPAKGASSIPTRSERALQQILEVLG